MHDLRRLRAFHAVAERRSFSAAALELGYAQSVVSHHVAALEAEFGVTLVDRSTRPVSLTEAGRRLATHAVEVLGHVAAAEEELRAVAGVETGLLRIGAFSSACTSFVPAALASFEARHPGIDVRLEGLESEPALHRLRAGELDLAVVWSLDGPAAPGPGDGVFERRHLADDHYRIALPARHRLARRRRVELADLAGERFSGPVGGDPGADAYLRWLRDACAAAGFEPDVAYEVVDVTIARAFVAAGLGVAVLPELTLGNTGADVVVRELPGSNPFRAVYGVWRAGRRIPAVAPMLDALAGAAAERLGAPGGTARG
ncbi:MAG TPA: LysR family transcriptional regulator [Capillimicrobium sp.]|nr:LysR family transcriptional regulator [Capillimicrobium sp.]